MKVKNSSVTVEFSKEDLVDFIKQKLGKDVSGMSIMDYSVDTDDNLELVFEDVSNED